MLNQEVITEAETAAIQIPAGNALILPEGSRIYITQMLGNSITAATDVGLVRISRAEAARVGIIPRKNPKQSRKKTSRWKNASGKCSTTSTTLKSRWILPDWASFMV